MKGDLKNPFAILVSTGELIHISDFNEIKDNSQLCCPECKKELIPKALNSTKVISHFSHLTTDNCSGYETVLHIWAKNVYKDLIGKKIILPSILNLYLRNEISKIQKKISEMYVDFRKSIESDLREKGIWIKGWYFKNYFPTTKEVNSSILLRSWIKLQCEKYIREKYQFKKDLEIVIDKVQIEVNMNGMIADVLINDRYAVEIFVTHKIDSEKENVIIANNISAIEIDLSKLGNDVFDKEKIISFLTTDSSRMTLYGDFVDLYGMDISSISTDEIINYIFEAAKEMLNNEILEKETLFNIEKNKELEKISQKKEALLCFDDIDNFLNLVTTTEPIDWKIYKLLMEELYLKGFPTGKITKLGKSNQFQVAYSFNISGSILEIKNTENLSKMYYETILLVKFNEYEKEREIVVKIPKGVLKDIQKKLDNGIISDFYGFKKGWNGIELKFDKD